MVKAFCNSPSYHCYKLHIIIIACCRKFILVTVSCANFGVHFFVSDALWSEHYLLWPASDVATLDAYPKAKH